MLVAENITYGYIYKELSNSSGKKKAFVTEYKQLAEILFLNLKADSLEYSRMISDEYDYVGISTAYNRRTNMVITVILLGTQTRASSVLKPDLTAPYNLQEEIGYKKWDRLKYWAKSIFGTDKYD